MKTESVGHAILGFSIGSLIGLGISAANQLSGTPKDQQINAGMLSMVTVPVGMFLPHPGVSGLGAGMLISSKIHQ